MNVLEEVLKNIEATPISAGVPISFGSGMKLLELFRLVDNSGKDVFTIKADGTVVLGPAYAAKAATDEFWKWISTQTNVIQLAVEQARRDERDAVANTLAQYGAPELADLIRN